METVLVIEDDRAVARLISNVLQIRGYTVLEPCELEAAERPGTPIHLLITDVILPNLNCQKVVEQWRSRCPDVKVLYMSGYPSETVGQFGISCSALNFLQKPFTLEQLTQKVRQVLDSRGHIRGEAA